MHNILVGLVNSSCKFLVMLNQIIVIVNRDVSVYTQST